MTWQTRADRRKISIVNQKKKKNSLRDIILEHFFVYTAETGENANEIIFVSSVPDVFGIDK